jgi:hypothetical protein
MASKPSQQLRTDRQVSPTDGNGSWKDLDHQQRLQAISIIFGIWKDRSETPKDGVGYQEKMRSEW